MNQKDFIERWRRSGGAEQANSHSFLKELSQLIGVPEPDPTQPDETRNTYVFEKAVSINNGDGTFSTGRVDLYRQKSFVWESKQGAERRADDFSGSGKNYSPFPDPVSFRIPLNRDQLELLIEAATANWAEVEPAIFGTLLERALDARERHKLGAHYTPRAYVERLVMPTVIEPLREEWENVYATAAQLFAEAA